MINLKTPKEIETMEEGGKHLACLVDLLASSIKVGMSTSDLEKISRNFIIDLKNQNKSHDISASFLGYDGYPASICVSINEEVVHGIPSKKIIEDGDVVSIDAGLMWDGFHTDSAVTVIAGKSKDGKITKLLNVTKEALSIGIKTAKIGNYIGDIGFAIQSYVEKNGFSVIRDLVGHGVGKKLHEPPQVPNFGISGTGEELEEGMVLAIEPMVSTGDWKIKLAKDNFTYITKDGSISAHFEHSVAITKNGPKILTLTKNK